MLPVALVAILVLPLLALAQQQTSQSGQSGQSNQPQPSQTVITSTSISTFPTLGPDRQASTATRTFVFTTTQVLTPAPQPSGNATTGNSTVSGNNTQSASTTTTPRNLPTAPTNVDGGGQGGAPSPGQTGGNFGPDDGFIAAATSLKHNAFIVGFIGFALGGAMLVF
ncbi:hypothetical protein P691DRAFT_755154 [Macrolepiota fuliginosa MF-IS2]|uniref:Uncharacterized protein n=1 Tax=Macrolepiota fuliginosa MF-IS2 TaxID=1400762 RepID=A0A9P6CA42_9AGAR|nr:hypothetical protein P691DRAFT_755154 [Macrolepiota fuliginosa MF-IS2]